MKRQIISMSVTYKNGHVETMRIFEDTKEDFLNAISKNDALEHATQIQ